MWRCKCSACTILLRVHCRTSGIAKEVSDPRWEFSLVWHEITYALIWQNKHINTFDKWQVAVKMSFMFHSRSGPISNNRLCITIEGQSMMSPIGC